MIPTFGHAASRDDPMMPATGGQCSCGEQYTTCSPTCRRIQRPRVTFAQAQDEATAAQAAVDRLEHKFASRAASSSGFDDSYLEDIMTSVPTVSELPIPQNVRRSKSHGVGAGSGSVVAGGGFARVNGRSRTYRLTIGYHDEQLRQRFQLNTQKLLQCAQETTPDKDSTSAILARKALRYRKVLERTAGIDLSDPTVDLSACLGVTWQRVGSE